jgi:hypothetical protein
MSIFDDISREGRDPPRPAVVYLKAVVHTFGINAMKRLATLRDSRRENSIPDFGRRFLLTRSFPSLN